MRDGIPISSSTTNSTEVPHITWAHLSKLEQKISPTSGLIRHLQLVLLSEVKDVEESTSLWHVHTVPLVKAAYIG